MIHAELARINQSLTKLRGTEKDLHDKRDHIIYQITMESIPKQASVASQIAQALILVYTEHNVTLETLFGVQTPEVNTAGLLQMAEYRDPETIEMFLKNGADVNAIDSDGFSVLEMVLQGHDFNYHRPGMWNKSVFDILAKYDVDREVVHHWILSDRCYEAPEYVKKFLGLLEPDV
jgi:hypothetical protein